MIQKCYYITIKRYLDHSPLPDWHKSYKIKEYFYISKLIENKQIIGHQ